MTGPFQILIVAADPQLAPECEAALASLPGEAPVVHRVVDARQAVETARNRHPNLAVIEMGRDLARLKAIVADLAAVSPDTLCVAAFRPELFGHEVSESAILIEALRSGIRDFLRRPVSAVDLGQLVERLSRHDTRGPVHWGKLVSFISNKGGVGKSTLAVNTALGLALRHPERVLLIDTSLQMGVCAAMLDLSPTLTLTDAARERDRLDDLLIRQLASPHSSGLHLLASRGRK
jgi:pilus assembly protein CpaE